MSANSGNQPSRSWLRRMADAEDTFGPPSVGGLAARVSARVPGRTGAIALYAFSAGVSPARRIALARLIELSRRRLRLTIADVASRAGLTPSVLASIERGDEVSIAPKSMKKLADALALPHQGLDSLARPTNRTDPRLDDAAMLFATSAGPVAALSPSERAALDKFVATLTKPAKRRSRKKAA